MVEVTRARRVVADLAAKEEIREAVFEPIDIYKHEPALLQRLEELAGQK